MCTNLQKCFFKTTFVLCFIIIAFTASAQRYYRDNRHYAPPPPYHYRSYAYAPFYRPMPRPGVSVNIGLGNNIYNRPYYRPYNVYGPSVGFHLNVLPFGYYPFYFGNTRYYYYDNTFYRSYNNNYEVIAPPMGAKIPSLPRNAQATIIDGQKYYELGGTYYRETFNQNNQVLYEVVGTNGVLNTEPIDQQQGNSFQQQKYEPMINDIVNQLPDQCRIVMINGQSLYVSPDNIYYEQVNSGNRIAYKIVGK